MGGLMMLNIFVSSHPYLGDHISEEECYPDWRVCRRIPAWNGILEAALSSHAQPPLPSSTAVISHLEVKGCCQQTQSHLLTGSSPYFLQCCF